MTGLRAQLLCQRQELPGRHEARRPVAGQLEGMLRNVLSARVSQYVLLEAVVHR